MTAYYNEFEPKTAAWLRELIAGGHLAPGDVDERSIADVQPGDLDGYTQCHFFAGIGGWSYALRLAMWPDSRPVWTGSCPCQPFSADGKARRVKPGVRLLVDGFPARVGLLRGFGNAIDPRPAAAFISAYCDVASPTDGAAANSTKVRTP